MHDDQHSGQVGAGGGGKGERRGQERRARGNGKGGGEKREPGKQKAGQEEGHKNSHKEFSGVSGTCQVSYRSDIIGKRCPLVHGSLRRPLDEYVYPDYPRHILERFVGDYDVILMGHTHSIFELALMIV